MKKIAQLLTFALVIQSFFAMAVTAIPEKVQYNQPDGTALEVFLFGDEFLHWIETTDGFIIVPGQDQGLYYAETDIQGELIAGSFLVHNPNERSIAENNYTQILNKEIKFSKRQQKAAAEARKLRFNTKSGTFPTTGNNNLLMIMVNFNDTYTTYSQANFTNYMNQMGYSGIGSFKDFYYENSWGQLTINTTVTAWVNVSKSHNYYGQNDINGYDTYPHELVYEAINLVDPTVDFSQFDNDLDGEVDGIAIIHQGYGEEASGNSNDIWSHSYSIYGLYTSAQCTKDGVLVYDYTIQPELLSTGGYNGMSTIGVMCHEFGHNMGAPDYYDTDYATNGQYDGTGDWDLMGGGSWNAIGSNPPGSQPAHHNIYTKVSYNWLISNQINTPGAFQLQPTLTNPKAYYYYTQTSNEYYLLENRQQSLSNFEAALPGSGMIIYHVDQNHITTNWSSNTINISAHQGLYPKDAGKGGINTSGCPFPGITNNTSFTDISTPNSKAWNGSNTTKPITDITQTGGTVSFNFMLPPPSGVIADTSGAFPSVMISWAPPQGAQAITEKWLFYDSGTAAMAWGVGMGTFQYGICFTPAQTSGYTQVEEFSLYTGSGTPTISPVYNLSIIQDSANGSPFFSIPIPFTANFVWSTITLPTPIIFDNTRNLFFIVHVTANTGDFPFVEDQNPAYDGYSNLFCLPGQPWSTWFTLFGMSGNWRMRAKISGTIPAKGKQAITLPKTWTNHNNFNAVSELKAPIGIPTVTGAHPADNAPKNMTGYQVSRDGTPIYVCPPTIISYPDNPPCPGDYVYTVQALYYEGISPLSAQATLNYPALLQLIFSPNDGGSVIGSGLYPYNSTATASAIPSTGYEFTAWDDGIAQISTANPYAFPIMNDMTLSATFSKTTHTIVLTSVPITGGTTTGSGVYTYGTTASCVATPAVGYNFTDWTENTTALSTQQTYSFVVTQDRNLNANFALKNYTITTTAAPSAGGSTSGGGNYLHGSTVNLSASTNSGYSFVNWTESGLLYATNSSVSFTATSNRDFIANFSKNCPDTLHLNAITVNTAFPDYEAKNIILSPLRKAIFILHEENCKMS
ncbi:MAG: M6 family metalloprotease domain-containing protein [Bacteroidia bacterium]|nr:M6 family metalloprotease domain-containing protein [Bacteroidia bacterium]